MRDVGELIALILAEMDGVQRGYADHRGELLFRAADALQALQGEKVTAQASVVAWQGVYERLEAHLRDRIAMGDPAKPEAYLSILSNCVRGVARESEQIANARWADTKRYDDAVASLRSELDRLTAFRDSELRSLEIAEAQVSALQGEVGRLREAWFAAERFSDVVAQDEDGRWFVNSLDADLLRADLGVKLLNSQPALAPIEEGLSASMTRECAGPQEVQHDGWRTIESAPKDGAYVDLWINGRRHSDCYWGLPHHECGEMGSYCDSDWHSIRAPGWVCGTFGEMIGRVYGPSHWMPIPTEPLRSDGGA